jgi:hypothetical protein
MLQQQKITKYFIIVCNFQVEEESNKINTCPGSSSSPEQIENNPEEGDASMETSQNEFSSSLLEMLAFVPLDYGVDDICKENEVMKQTLLH